MQLESTKVALKSSAGFLYWKAEVRTVISYPWNAIQLTVRDCDFTNMWILLKHIPRKIMYLAKSVLSLTKRMAGFVSFWTSCSR